MEQLAVGRSVRACHSMRCLIMKGVVVNVKHGSTAASCCGAVHAKHSLGVAGLTMSRIYEEGRRKTTRTHSYAPGTQ